MERFLELYFHSYFIRLRLLSNCSYTLGLVLFTKKILAWFGFRFDFSADISLKTTLAFILDESIVVPVCTFLCLLMIMSAFLDRLEEWLVSFVSRRRNIRAFGIKRAIKYDWVVRNGNRYSRGKNFSHFERAAPRFAEGEFNIFKLFKIINGTFVFYLLILLVNILTTPSGRLTYIIFFLGVLIYWAFLDIYVDYLTLKKEKYFFEEMLRTLQKEEEFVAD